MSARGPLGEIRVVECAAGLPASYAGFLLAGFGAEVVRIEPAETSPGVPGDHVLRRGKRSAVLEDGDTRAAACRHALCANADILLADETAPEVEPAAGRIDCRVSPWGAAGHPQRLPADEALVAALTGTQAMQWSWAGSPVWLATPLIGYMTGALAALGVTAALLARARGAPGQRVEVSAVGGALALGSGTYVRGPGQRGSLLAGGDPRGVYPNYGVYRTSDGWLFVGALTQPFWVKLVTLLEQVDLLADPRLQGHPFSFGAPDTRTFVRAALDPIFAARTTAEWLARLREADIPCGPVRTREEALADADARALGLVIGLDDPVLGPTWQPAEPAFFSHTPAPPPRPASLRGADTGTVCAEARRRERTTPARVAAPPASCLAGMRVLDLTSYIAGPFCPLLLGDLGADVVKIETAEGDPFRMAAFAFVGWNRGKRSLVLDLKRAEGCDVFLDLARAADVVVDNFRGGVMERLGIGWDRLSAENPRLVHTSITGYGTTGPLAGLPGFDPVFQARCGLMLAQGGDEPVFHMIAYNDYMAGALGALATVAALLAREGTGRGQRVDVSLFRTSYVAQAAHMIAYRGRPAITAGGRDYLGPAAARRIYACRDGWLCVAARDAAQAAALGRLAGAGLALDDPPDGAVATAVATWLAPEARADALARLAAVGVPAAPCLDFDEVFVEPYLLAAGAITTQEHPTFGTLELAGPFMRFAATPIAYRRSAPLLGADGPAVLAEVGYPEGRIAELVAAGVVGTP
ncbi:MAG: CoA transferase [Deltaproteobacteria bacterium]|nr:CoA transferase [Deltaproteobacteria bacterium]